MGWKNTRDTNLESGHKKVSLKATNTACTFWNSLLIRRATNDAINTLDFGMETITKVLLSVKVISVTQQSKKAW